jgi:hypothetical protein
MVSDSKSLSEGDVLANAPQSISKGRDSVPDKLVN